MPQPGPSLNFALWGFEVDSCCSSPESPPALQRASAGEDKAFSPYSALGPAAPAHPAPSSSQAPAQPRLPLLRARARCAAQLWGHKPPVTWPKRGPGSRIFPPWEFSTQVAVAAVLWPSSDGTQYYRAATHSRSHFEPVCSAMVPGKLGEVRAEREDVLIP